jgi:membrane-associated phospholipid phosphatase
MHRASRRFRLRPLVAGATALTLCAATPSRASAQDADVVPAPPARTESEPPFTLAGALVLGTLGGLGLGLSLGDRSHSATPLTPIDATDAVIAGTIVALFASPHLIDRGPLPAPAPPGQINAFDRKVRSFLLGNRSWAGLATLDNVSTATLVASVVEPIGWIATSDIPHKWSRDLPVVAESIGLALGANVMVKHIAHRSRPADHFCAAEKKEDCPKDTRLSFYSGHTSSAFSAAIAMGRLAEFHDLKNTGWIWGTGLTLATTTGVLRVMADRHYATDVLVGMATGALAGAVVPKLHKPDATAATPTTARHSPPMLASVLALGPEQSTRLVAGAPAGGGFYLGVQGRW